MNKRDLELKKKLKKKCKLSLWFFILIKTVYILTETSSRYTILHIANKSKGCFVSGSFVSTDVLSPPTFCLPDVLSLRTFCLYGRFVPWTLCLRLFCLRTFCLWMFCPYGRFVSRHFVWAPEFRSKESKRVPPERVKAKR